MSSAMEGKSNLSFILDKPLSVSFSSRPLPQLSSPYDVILAINYTGICGSDVHYWQHGSIGPFVVKDPMVLGHESAGTVVQVGESVTTLKIGDRVAVEPGYPCRRCGNCLRGKYNLCPNMRFAATPPYDGTLTGFWAAPEDFCYPLPDNVSLQEGALIEPLAVGVHIVRQARVQPGQSVVVMGAGPVGLLCAAVAKAYGASKIGIVDIVPSKLEFAKKFAATHAYLSQRVSPEQNAENIRKEFDLPDGADVVIDASGAEPSIQASIHVVRIGGVYVQGGMGKPDITFPIMALCTKEVEAHGSFRYGSGDYKLAVELVASGKIPVKMLISETVAFEQAAEAFSKVKEGQVIKILIAGPNEKHEGASGVKSAVGATNTSQDKSATPAVGTTSQTAEPNQHATGIAAGTAAGIATTVAAGGAAHHAASQHEDNTANAPSSTSLNYPQSHTSEATKYTDNENTPSEPPLSIAETGIPQTTTGDSAPQSAIGAGTPGRAAETGSLAGLSSHHSREQQQPAVSEKPGSVPSTFAVGEKPGSVPQQLPVHEKPGSGPSTATTAGLVGAGTAAAVGTGAAAQSAAAPAGETSEGDQHASVPSRSSYPEAEKALQENASQQTGSAAPPTSSEQSETTGASATGASTSASASGTGAGETSSTTGNTTSGTTGRESETAKIQKEATGSSGGVASSGGGSLLDAAKSAFSSLQK